MLIFIKISKNFLNCQDKNKAYDVTFLLVCISIGGYPVFLDESFDFFNLIVFLLFFTEIYHPRTVVTSQITLLL